MKVSELIARLQRHLDETGHDCKVVHMVSSTFCDEVDTDWEELEDIVYGGTEVEV